MATLRSVIQHGKAEKYKPDNKYIYILGGERREQQTTHGDPEVRRGRAPHCSNTRCRQHRFDCLQTVGNVTWRKDDIHYIDDTVHYIDDTVHYIDDTAHYMGDTVHYMGDTVHYMGDTVHYMGDAVHFYG